MKKLSIAIFIVFLFSQISFSQDCTQPSITETTGQGTYCFGEEVTLTITGTLGDATEWQWSTGASCGETIIENSNSTSITITVEDTISYFVRGIGGCVENAAACTEIKVYLDNDPPLVTCPENIVVQNDEGLCSAVVTYDVPTATDKCDEDVTVEQTEGLGSGAIFPVGETTETYVFTDSQGNTTICSFTVTVEDKEAPVLISCPSDIQVENDPGVCGAVVTYELPTASDNCDDEVTVELTEGLASGETFPVDMTIVTYLISDVNGNMTTCSFTVTVADTEAPVITCPVDIDVENDPGECGAIVTYEMPTATDNCGVTEIVQTEGLGSGAMFPVGTTIETFIARDEAGNESSCSISVTVRDTEPPVITLSKNLKTKWPPNHKAFKIMIDDYIASVWDNCPGVSIEDVIIDEVSSDEPQNEQGDGNTESDITMGDDCKTVHLLAERQGGGNGRVYKIELALVDAHGNIGYETIRAEISHDQSKKKSVIDDGPAYVVNGCDIELPEEVAEVEDGNMTGGNEVGNDKDGEGEGGEEMSIVNNNENLITYPNPYENSFSINFTALANDQISIQLYNTAGIKIKRIYEGRVEKSKHYNWSVELEDIKDKMMILILRGNHHYSQSKIGKK
jgi:hypothetical protein